MQQFQTPQFITVEDKVIGPFTIKQFIFIAAGGLLIVFLRTIFEGFVLYLLALIIGSSAAAFAFLKINEQPLPKIAKNAFLFYVKPRLYIWKHEEAKKEAAKKPEEKVAVSQVPKMSISKLDNLSWSLDVKEEKK